MELMGKMQPQAVNIEESVLGAIMLENCIETVTTILEPRSFYKDSHVRIYTAILRLYTKSEPIDIRTVMEELKKSKELDVIGGAYYISQLTNSVSSSANVEFHARIIAQKFIQRELIRNSTEIISKSYDDSNDVFDILDYAEKGITQLTSKINTTKIDGIVSVYNKWAEHNTEILKNKDGISGVPSGFNKIDTITGGWQKSDLVIIAARPAMGKTSLMLQLARNAAVNFKKSVAIFSIEMSKLQIMTRLMSQETSTSSHRYTRYGLNENEFNVNMNQCAGLINSNVFIDDTPAIKISEFKSKARKLKRDHDIDAIFIDYLQIMSTGEKTRGKTEDVGLISNSLKAVAKELNIPVIALSQMSREVEKRGGSRRPELSDLRNSGEIEQDADLVIFVHRDEYYGVTEDDHGHSTVGKAAIIIEKNRSGAIGDVILNWDAPTTAFSNIIGYGDIQPKSELKPNLTFESQKDEPF